MDPDLKLDISEDQNTITYKGKTYIAADCPDKMQCCSFCAACYPGLFLFEMPCSELPCRPNLRKDKRNVFFKLK